MQVLIFKIFVGWLPKKVPKVPFFFSLEGTLLLRDTCLFHMSYSLIVFLSCLFAE